MIKEAIGGFCMALADSVPGVSGGTVAFIMGFYDQFIGSVHDLAFGKMEDKKKAIAYHIYVVSSLFIGFIAGASPLIIREERDGFKQFGKGILFLILGIVLVAGITWLNGRAGTSSMDLSHFQLGNAIKLFFIGMIAISAMFLPGISGSTLLLIFGVYIPVISAIRAALGLQLSYVPNLFFFGLGIVAGACSVVKIIKVCLERFRPQTLYCIVGMMVGSFYAIVMGPTTLEEAQAPLAFSSFHWIAGIIGLALVLGMQFAKEKGKKA